MKAGINGVLNMSVLERLVDEAAEGSGGWAIGIGNVSPDRDDAHAPDLLLLENEIAPMFYQEREQARRPNGLRRVRQSLQYVSAHFNCQRMISEYNIQLYEPAHKASRHGAGRFSALGRLQWSRCVQTHWPNVDFLDAGIGPIRRC